MLLHVCLQQSHSFLHGSSICLTACTELWLLVPTLQQDKEDYTAAVYQAEYLDASCFAAFSCTSLSCLRYCSFSCSFACIALKPAACLLIFPEDRRAMHVNTQREKDVEMKQHKRSVEESFRTQEAFLTNDGSLQLLFMPGY